MGRRFFGIVLIVLGAGFAVSSIALLIEIALELVKGRELGEEGAGFAFSGFLILGLAFLLLRAGWRRARRTPTIE